MLDSIILRRTMSMPPFAPTPLPLTAADGYTLQALRYAPQGEPTGRLIVAGATGVPQRFYARFAQFAAARGIEAWTLDYRGVGLSRPPELRGFRMNYLDWARLDLAALLEHVSAQGQEPLWMVGHSYGGHAFGLLPGHERVQRLATFATGAGWHGWMPPLERLRVKLLWNVVGPLLVRTTGYLAWPSSSPACASPSAPSTPPTTSGPRAPRATPSWPPTPAHSWSASPSSPAA